MADQDDPAVQRGRSPGHSGRASVSSTDNISVGTSAMTSPLTADFKPPETETPTAPVFPLLNNNPPAVPEASKKAGAGLPVQDYGNDEEPSVAKPFQRTASPSEELNKRNVGAEYEKVGDQGCCKMHKYSFYETASRYYIVGADVMDLRFRILKIDRTADIGNLSVAEDDIVYTKKETSQLLNAIDDGNKSSGGLKLKCAMWGLLGFIRFTGTYYMLIITKRSQVAMIGGHYIYQIDGTELVPLTTTATSKFKSDNRSAEEARFIAILNNLDLSRSFYFSYSYDITRTLQHNISKERDALRQGLPYPHPQDYNAMFVWNSYLLQPASEALSYPTDWCLPIIHGYIDQAALSVYGRTVYITIIARRSRFFAGARFLKRGANDLGYVANDVETEQIVSEALTTSFHAPGPRLFANPSYTSYVQHRGSIPLYWTQDNTGVTPKPPIELNLVDPFYSAAALHFDNLFERYGAPIYVLNLVKAKEKQPRESKLLREFTKAINYLNQFLPDDKKIIHKAWDMSRASKSRSEDVIGTLEAIAEEVVTTTGFFRNGDGKTVMPTMQNGVARTNCIDCLDRTNAAQFVIGKRALGHQLYALGVTSTTAVDYDTDAVNLFTHMYHDHGDTIAVQYGGSQLVNTMETYRKINQWTSHSRDMVESFKRYYNNSFLDAQRQEAYNLFLGNYIFAHGQPMLWDLATDYYLHHSDPRSFAEKMKSRRNYIQWYNPEFLKTKELLPYVAPRGEIRGKSLAFFDDYWLEYYKPLALSSLLKVFSFKMNSTLTYIPFKSTQEGRYDLSPFRVRTTMEDDKSDKKKTKKGVTIMDPHEESAKEITELKNIKEPDLADDAASIRSNTTTATTGTTVKRISIQRWLAPSGEKEKGSHGIMKEPYALPHMTGVSHSKPKLTSRDKTKAAQWTFAQMVSESLNPSVTSHEAEDYSRYISHPQHLPLVVSTETPTVDVNSEYADYVNHLHGDWQVPAIVNMGFEKGVEGANEEDLAEYVDFLTVPENPLTVREEDGGKKRYKAYRKWLRGKSLFKQQPVD